MFDLLPLAIPIRCQALQGEDQQRVAVPALLPDFLALVEDRLIPALDGAPLRLGEPGTVKALPSVKKAEVDLSKDPRFIPGPAPNLKPIPAPKAVELPRKPVDRFDPGPGPVLSELPEARLLVPAEPDVEDDGAGVNEVERAMAAEFAPEAATEKKAEVKEAKEEKREAKKNVRR